MHSTPMSKASMVVNRFPHRAIALALLACAGAACAEAGAPGRCSFVAFVEESDPAGLNVRAAPSLKSRVLGKLPPVWVDKADGARVRIRTEVTDASNGWFKIRNSSDEEQLTEQPARPTYAGEGWVTGRKLVALVQSDVGRIRPDGSAPVGLQLTPEQEFNMDALQRASTLVDCQGGWVQVEFVEAKIPVELRKSLQVAPEAHAGFPPGRFRLWINKICGLQETSCDGL